MGSSWWEGGSCRGFALIGHSTVPTDHERGLGDQIRHAGPVHCTVLYATCGGPASTPRMIARVVPPDCTYCSETRDFPVSTELYFTALYVQAVLCSTVLYCTVTVRVIQDA